MRASLVVAVGLAASPGCDSDPLPLSLSPITDAVFFDVSPSGRLLLYQEGGAAGATSTVARLAQRAGAVWVGDLPMGVPTRIDDERSIWFAGDSIVYTFGEVGPMGHLERHAVLRRPDEVPNLIAGGAWGYVAGHSIRGNVVAFVQQDLDASQLKVIDMRGGNGSVGAELGIEGADLAYGVAVSPSGRFVGYTQGAASRPGRSEGRIVDLDRLSQIVTRPEEQAGFAHRVTGFASDETRAVVAYFPDVRRFDPIDQYQVDLVDLATGVIEKWPDTPLGFTVESARLVGNEVRMIGERDGVPVAVRARRERMDVVTLHEGAASVDWIPVHEPWSSAARSHRYAVASGSDLGSDVVLIDFEADPLYVHRVRARSGEDAVRVVRNGAMVAVDQTGQVALLSPPFGEPTILRDRELADPAEPGGIVLLYGLQAGSNGARVRDGTLYAWRDGRETLVARGVGWTLGRDDPPRAFVQRVATDETVSPPAGPGIYVFTLE